MRAPEGGECHQAPKGQDECPQGPKLKATMPPIEQDKYPPGPNFNSNRHPKGKMNAPKGPPEQD